MSGMIPIGGIGDISAGDYGVTGDGSVAGLKNRTQANVEAALKSKVAGSAGWGGASGTFFGSLLGGFATGITGFISSLFGGLSGTSGGGFLDLLGHFIGMQNSITTNTEAIADLSLIAPTPATPAWVADVQDMATVPRQDVKTWTGATSSAGAGDAAHTHNVSLRVPLWSPDVQKFPIGEGGKAYYMPCVVDRSGLLAKLSWIVGADSSLLDIQSYNMSVCAYNPSSGAIQKVWDSGNLASTLSATTTQQETEVTLGLTSAQGWCTPGQILFVAHHQTAWGILQNPRSFAYAPTNPIIRPASRLLRFPMYVTSSYYSGIPSTINLSALTGINWGCGWAALSVDTTATPPTAP